MWFEGPEATSAVAGGGLAGWIVAWVERWCHGVLLLLRELGSAPGACGIGGVVFRVAGSPLCWESPVLAFFAEVDVLAGDWVELAQYQAVWVVAAILFRHVGIARACC